MEIIVNTLAKQPTYTISKLYIDGTYFCDVLEDTDRGLTKDMSEEEIRKIKVPNETRIPLGTYDLRMDVISPKFSNYQRYPWAKELKGKIPRLIGVPGFSGILIHPGTDNNSTSGCLCVGENKIKGKIINSVATFLKLYTVLAKAAERNEKITITIK